MRDYRTKVKEAARLRNGEPLYNGSLDHAAVLAEEMFNNAENDVNILSGNLNARVYGTSVLIEKARQFLSDTDHKIRILLENSDTVDPVDHPFVREFCENDDVKFKSLPDDMKDEINYHFIVMDSDSYRFEEDKGNPSAIAAFGDKTGGENLTKIFKVLWNGSEEIIFEKLAS